MQENLLNLQNKYSTLNMNIKIKIFFYSLYYYNFINFKITYKLKIL